jgi:hypothetical protein
MGNSLECWILKKERNEGTRKGKEQNQDIGKASSLQGLGWHICSPIDQ